MIAHGVSYLLPLLCSYSIVRSVYRFLVVPVESFGALSTLH
jgi:hypothetical protein